MNLGRTPEIRPLLSRQRYCSTRCGTERNNWLLRDAKLYEIGAGTSEIRRMLIGRELFELTA